jgi:hypothetical protein
MDVATDKAYWDGVVRKLDSEDASERGWASHVLMIEENLQSALKHCDAARLRERVSYLADHDSDEYAGSNCLHIVKMLERHDA